MGAEKSLQVLHSQILLLFRKSILHRNCTLHILPAIQYKIVSNYQLTICYCCCKMIVWLLSESMVQVINFVLLSSGWWVGLMVKLVVMFKNLWWRSKN